MSNSNIIKNFRVKKDFVRIEINNENYKFLRKELARFYQHGRTSIFYHCRHVAYFSYYLALQINKRFNAKVDFEALVNAACMHDLFMYDWHEKGGNHKLHGYTHPHTAASNAKTYCNANEKEQNIIETHMWPLTITKIPRSKEAWLVCLCDKYCAIKETIYR